MEIEVSEESLMIKTLPYHLQNLLWLCLSHALGEGKDPKTVNLIISRSATGVVLDLIVQQHSLPRDPFPTGREEYLLAELGGTLALDHAGGKISLALNS